MTKVLILTDDASWGSSLAPILQEVAHVSVLEVNSESQLIQAARDADIVVVKGSEHRKLFSRRLVGCLERTRIVFTMGVGTDGICVAAMSEKGIVLCNNPDFCTTEVAEHTIALIFSVWRRIQWMNQKMREEGWATWNDFRPIYRLAGKIAGVIGFGRIGQAVSGKLRALGVRVIAYDHRWSEKKDLFTQLEVEAVEFSSLLQSADVITLHVPLTPSSEGMLGEKELRTMKHGAFLINTSRGSVVDERALIKILQERKISAALDVFATEPLPGNSPLFELDNVILSPHLGSTSEEAVALADLATEIKQVVLGKAPDCIVNRDVLD